MVSNELIADQGFPLRGSAGGRLSDPPEQADVVVVGAGVVGLLTARAVAKQEHRVVLLDAGTPGAGQSGRNLGFVRQQGRDQAETELMARAAELWAQLARELGPTLGYTQGGHLVLADTAHQADDVAAWLPVAKEHAIPVEVFEGRAVNRAFPWLRGDWRLAVRTPGDSNIDPAAACTAVIDALQREGVSLVDHCAVTSLRRDSHSWTVQTDRGTIRAAAVVVAAGLWTARLLSMVALNIPLHGGRATLALTNPVAHVTSSTVWHPGGLGFRQTSSGRFVLGFGGFADVDIRVEDIRGAARLMPIWWRNRRQMRLHVTRGLLSDLGAAATRRPLPPHSFAEPTANLHQAARIPAALASLVDLDQEARLDAVWAGTVDATPDFLPVIDEPAPGLVVAAGMSGHGMGIAPGVAEAVCELLAGRGTTCSLDAFRLSRFGSRG